MFWRGVNSLTLEFKLMEGLKLAHSVLKVFIGACTVKGWDKLGVKEGVNAGHSKVFWKVLWG
jgi:hypothetical protein